MHYKINSGNHVFSVSNGNSKIGKDTLILNMGSATNCPSKFLGLCRIPAGKCYALKAERLYPTCLPCREKQSDYWLNTEVWKIIEDFDTLLLKHKTLKARVKYLRFNESGDFYSQDCIKKLSVIALYLKEHYGIITYGYSARSDLDFTNVFFNVKGSDHSQGNGQCIARKIKKGVKQYHENNKTYFACPGNCRNCKLCKTTAFNVVIRLH